MTDEAAALVGAACTALRRLRVVKVNLLESVLVDMMAVELEASGLAVGREVRIAAGCRIDLVIPLADGRFVGIEVKKSRPNAARTTAQVERYARTGRLAAVIFVAERGFDLPPTIDGVPVTVVSLSAAFGISL